MADCTSLITAPDFSYGGGGLLDAIRSGFIKNFVAMRCDVTIPDITDDTAIAAQVAAGTVFTSPTLTGEVPFPTTGGEIVENCQPAQPSERTYNFNWTSVRVDNTSLTDFTTMEALQDSLGTWTIAPVTCDDVLLVPQEFSVDGVFFDMRGIISSVFDNSSTQKWEGQLLFKYGSVLNGVQLSASVITALGL